MFKALRRFFGFDSIRKNHRVVNRRSRDRFERLEDRSMLSASADILFLLTNQGLSKIRIRTTTSTARRTT
jgi:hypothetical protein